uniref:Uncharacterized protein n=1 Tax=Anopheles funestus TaxID=62324 RepID=A0A182S2Z1_ANOFN
MLREFCPICAYPRNRCRQYNSRFTLTTL